jgi:CRP/FNR family transcriptional regulator, cyclic AMP receptor protein
MVARACRGVYKMADWSMLEGRMDYISIFRRIADDPGSAEGEYLRLPGWRDEQWQKLFAATTPRPFKASEFVIQRGVKDHALYLVAAGLLEVGVTYIDGVSISPLAKIGVGSVIGEQSFFDGQPRSANVFAVADGELLCLTPEKFHEFSEAEPALARDVLFALARILSLRLRHTTFRVRH